MEEIKKLSIEEMALLFGGESKEVISAMADISSDLEFEYRIPTKQELERITLDVLRRLDQIGSEIPRAGEERRGDWEKGWSENLNEFVDGGFQVSDLVPKYLRPNEPVRLHRKIVVPIQEHFVRDYTLLFRNWIFNKYLQPFDNIYEFGCGPGAHLAYLAKKFPHKNIYGFDWAEASIQIIETMSKKFKWKLEGQRFDFFNPDLSLKIKNNSAVVTFGALEQTGARYRDFMDYIYSQKPNLCLHVEPMNELYDENNLVDYLSLKYHKHRGYLDGFLNFLKDWESKGLVKIDKIHRHYLGTKFAETYSYVVWRPIEPVKKG
jgi:SAM-dependent methyltransferase